MHHVRGDRAIAAGRARAAGAVSDSLDGRSFDARDGRAGHLVSQVPQVAHEEQGLRARGQRRLSSMKWACQRLLCWIGGVWLCGLASFVRRLHGLPLA